MESSDVVTRSVIVVAPITETTTNGVNIAIAVHGNSLSYAKPFPEISKIEVFIGDNFKRWQERILSILDMHGVAFALSNLAPKSN